MNSILIDSSNVVIYLQTTYETFRYRADNRINVYDRGCANNFVEVLCTKKEPSKFNFRAYVVEISSKPPRASIQGAATGNSDDGRREKVEDDDLEMGDVLKMSKSRNSGGNSDIRSRVSERLSPRFSEVGLPLDFESQQVPSPRPEKHHYNNWSTRNERR